MICCYRQHFVATVRNMMAVETLWRARHPVYMPSTPPTPKEQMRAMGLAIQALRERARVNGKKVSQEDAAARIGKTRQAWQNYEDGSRQVILRSDVQDEIAHGLDTTREALLLEYEKILGRPPAREPVHDRRAHELLIGSRAKGGQRAPLAYDMSEPESVFDMEWVFGPNGSGLRVAGDSMTGYVESGQLVIFDRTRWPRRGEGCVVETTDGEYYVKEYVEQEGDILRLRQRFPEQIVEFPMKDVKGVYAVRLRGA